MNKYKRFIQSQYEKAKSTASGFIASRNEEEEGTIELNSQYYVELKAIADKQGTNVQAIVNEIIVQYLVSVNTQNKSTPITLEQKEDNPLLYLDGICKLED
ncbi:hypothetical protein [Paenibacillus paeoniae]|uniref:Uncharacterized protein n=1 Tax=Paenibacillus paeoniae TaxID=2292705 RepID=A0A371PIB5_9BACL|nr:hypothetical protein [Paenibacillus paeoniae]REK75120.1 hypothetical protein DX130_15930 [Paenibacillus paeoniae]